MQYCQETDLLPDAQFERCQGLFFCRYWALEAACCTAACMVFPSYTYVYWQRRAQSFGWPLAPDRNRETNERSWLPPIAPPPSPPRYARTDAFDGSIGIGIGGPHSLSVARDTNDRTHNLVGGLLVSFLLLLLRFQIFL